MPLRINRQLKAAINTYYAFKNKNGNGFFESGEVKEACLEQVSKAATAAKIGYMVVPGTFFFTKGKRNLEVNGPIL